MRGPTYVTVKGARRYFASLAKDFCMDSATIEKIKKAETMAEVEQVWRKAIRDL